jgi:hypothetical protein
MSGAGCERKLAFAVNRMGLPVFRCACEMHDSEVWFRWLPGPGRWERWQGYTSSGLATSLDLAPLQHLTVRQLSMCSALLLERSVNTCLPGSAV